MATSSANIHAADRQWNETVAIAGPVANPSKPHEVLPPGACDCHAHLFGPAATYPYAPGRGYTPPDAPREAYLALLDHLGFSRGILVQGNAHGYDNRVILDALGAHPDRFRGVAITDRRVDDATLRQWHALGMRGLRFHINEQDQGYVRGVGLDVFEAFRPTMRELGWVAQFWCDWPALPRVAPLLAEVSREMPVVIDHMMVFPPTEGLNHPVFQTLLRLVGEGAVVIKCSGYYRFAHGPDYEAVRPFHDALVAANPDGLVFGMDWPHPQVDKEHMPDEGHLVDLFHAWTPDPTIRTKILVDTPHRLFWRA